MPPRDDDSFVQMAVDVATIKADVGHIKQSVQAWDGTCERRRTAITNRLEAVATSGESTRVWLERAKMMAVGLVALCSGLGVREALPYLIRWLGL